MATEHTAKMMSRFAKGGYIYRDETGSLALVIGGAAFRGVMVTREKQVTLN